MNPGLIAINKLVINKYSEKKTKSKGNTMEYLNTARWEQDDASERKRERIQNGMC
jgi:hypothetical protein